MNTFDLLNQHIPCWTIAHTPLGADVYHPGCTCGWSGIPCATDNEVLDQYQAHLAREIDRQRPIGDAAQIKDSAINGTQIYSPSAEGDLAQAWRDVVADHAAGRTHVTVSSIDADTHWCRLHRLMQAHTGEAGS